MLIVYPVKDLRIDFFRALDDHKKRDATFSVRGNGLGRRPRSMRRGLPGTE